MDRYQLKRTIIWTLLLLNAFLLLSLILQQNSQRSAVHQVNEQLSALFEADGISLDSGIIPGRKPSTLLRVETTDSPEQQAAAFLLGGTPESADQGGGIHAYTGRNGAALFRSNGTFEAVGTLSSQPEEFCRKFCKQFSYEYPDIRIEPDNTCVIECIMQYERQPVYNVKAVFTVTNGAVTSVTGTFLAGSMSEETGRDLLSAQAALTALQAFRRENYSVLSAVEEITLCYGFQGDLAEELLLIPTWCIATDTGNYYVDCLSGSVTLG